MRYWQLLTLLILLLAGCQSAFGDDRYYRIELLVMRHLDGVPDGQAVDSLRDFTSALDLMPPETPPVDENHSGAAPALAETAPPTAVEGSLVVGQESADPSIEVEEPPQPAAILVEERSDLMQQVWRRLRSSAGFRPEFYMSWEQPDREPYPAIRIHDLVVVQEEDPWAEQRAATELPPADSPLLPPPIRFYAIDGEARFRRSRLLHLDLDLEIRTPLADDSTSAPGGSLNAPEVRQLSAQVFQLISIRQSRPVQTQQLEYFDGPVYSVLAYITQVDAWPDKEQEADPNQPVEAGPSIDGE